MKNVSHPTLFVWMSNTVNASDFSIIILRLLVIIEYLQSQMGPVLAV